jgi:transcriptional regulator with XRE-family HTH domain
MLSEERHVLTVLKTAMRVLGISNRDVERRLGLSGSYLSRLFSGDIDLRFSHLVSISRAIGMEPEELLWLAYPRGAAPPSPPRLAVPLEAAVERAVAGLVRQLSSGLAGGKNPPQPPAL